MSIPAKAIYIFSVIPSKLSMAIIAEIEKNPKINMKAQEITNSQNNL